MPPLSCRVQILLPLTGLPFLLSTSWWTPFYHLLSVKPSTPIQVPCYIPTQTSPPSCRRTHPPFTFLTSQHLHSHKQIPDPPHKPCPFLIIPCSGSTLPSIQPRKAETWSLLRYIPLPPPHPHILPIFQVLSFLPSHFQFNQLSLSTYTTTIVQVTIISCLNYYNFVTNTLISNILPRSILHTMIWKIFWKCKFNVTSFLKLFTCFPIVCCLSTHSLTWSMRLCVVWPRPNFLTTPFNAYCITYIILATLVTFLFAAAS